MMRHYQRAVGYFAQDGRSRCDVHVIADFYRRDQLRVAADHASIADHRLMLLVAIVVHRDDTASDVGIGADSRVTEVAQMACLGAASDARFLGLDEIADAVMAGEFGAGAQICKGADFGVLANHTIFGANTELQMASRANRHVAEPCSAVDTDP